MANSHIGEFEQMVLLAILRRGDEAYANAVRDELEANADRSVSRGALYRTFDRLASKGYVKWDFESTVVPERGGHPMRRFGVTRAGLKALRNSRNALMRMWDGLEAVLTD